MVASRALVFRPLVKGNEALGTRLPISKKYTVSQCRMSLSTYYLEYGRHAVRLHRRRRRHRHAYAPTSNNASHDNHEKINSWVSCSLYVYGALLEALRAAGAPLKIEIWFIVGSTLIDNEYASLLFCQTFRMCFCMFRTYVERFCKSF